MTDNGSILEEYVRKPDPSFSWSVTQCAELKTHKYVVIRLCSQTWLSEELLDRSVWWHWLAIIIPHELSSDKVFLQLSGGSNLDPTPSKPVDRLVKLALSTGSVVVDVGQIPNQPIRFAESPDECRREDDIIAYLQARYDPGKHPTALLRLPMVKAAIAAINAVEEYFASENGMRIGGFVVSGASKRGWTAWLTGLLESRVIGMVPLVINILNVEAVARHDWETKGFFSAAWNAYEKHKVTDALGTERFRQVIAIEDPIRYLKSPRMKIPKYIVNSAGDEYFPPDSTRYSYPLLPEPKLLRVLPNTNHKMEGADPIESVAAWFWRLSRGKRIPKCVWEHKRDGALVVRTDENPSAVRLWKAITPAGRDFRLEMIGPSFEATSLQISNGGIIVVNVEMPAEGFVAYFVELTFGKLVISTEVFVRPDLFPFEWRRTD